MITFEKAYEAAGARLRSIASCDEYENGYVFWESDGSDCIAADGGIGHGEIAVLKKDGKVMNMPLFIMEGTGGYRRSRLGNRRTYRKRRGSE